MSRQLEDFAGIIAQAQKDLLELKQRQFAGTSNTAVRESQTANTWDIDRNVNLGAGVSNEQYLFTFVADQQKAPLAAFRPTILVDNVPLTNDSSFFQQNFVPFFSPIGLTDSEFERLAVVAYYTFTATSLAYNLKIKMRVLSNDTGVIGFRINQNV